MAQIDIGKIKPVFKGTYDNSTAYVLDDIVYYNGSSYVAKTSTTGNLPTDATKWNVLASGSGGIWDGSLSLGSAGQFVKVNSGATALEFGSVSAPTEFKVATNSNTSTATYTGTGTSYTDHITQAITTTIVAPVICNCDFQHSYENGSVNFVGRFVLTPSSGSDIVGNPQQIAVYGFGNNRALGSHNMFTAFQDVPVGSYTVKLQMINDGGSGSTGYLNYFAGGSGVGGDRIYVMYK